MLSTQKKKKKVKAVHQKRKLFRANEPLLSVFMWGVNHTIQGLTHVSLPVMLLPDDFKAYAKTKVDNHMFNKENMPSRFKVKEYCPLVFRNLRERFGVPDDDYVNSLTKAEPIDQSDVPGKGGSRYLMSYDKQFVIKTLSGDDVETVHHILKDYHQYVVERHAVTLLPQYLGLYRLTVADQETHLVVMRNIFSPLKKIHRKYDLKGSTVDRTASDKEKSKDLPTFKDNDFVSEGVLIDVGTAGKEQFMATLTADVEWLSSQNLMDYSLLIGIHDGDRAFMEAEDAPDGGTPAHTAEEHSDSCDDEIDQPPPRHASSPTPSDGPDAPAAGGPWSAPSYEALHGGRYASSVDPDRYAVISDPGRGHHDVYFMGLVDCLTRYGVWKRTANAAKQVKHGHDADISTVHPEQYGKRLLDFVGKALQ